MKTFDEIIEELIYSTTWSDNITIDDVHDCMKESARVALERACNEVLKERDKDCWDKFDDGYNSGLVSAKQIIMSVLEEMSDG